MITEKELKELHDAKNLLSTFLLRSERILRVYYRGSLGDVEMALLKEVVGRGKELFKES